jgi:hypothetical protein
VPPDRRRDSGGMERERGEGVGKERGGGGEVVGPFRPESESERSFWFKLPVLFLLNFCVSLPWNTCIFDICFYNTLFLCKCVIDTLRKHLV